MLRLKQASRHGFSLLEIVLAGVVLLVVLYVLIGLANSGRKLEDTFSAHLGLQLDAQKSLSQLIRELQEAIIVVLPAPGNTLPHAIFRDRVQRLVMFSLVPSGIPGEWKLQRVARGPAGVETTVLLSGVRRLTFTAASDAALQVHMTLGNGDRRYAFHTAVRLRNRDAAELE